MSATHLTDSARRAVLLDVPIDAHTMSTLLARIQELIAAPGCSTGYAVNANSLNLASVHPDYLRGLQNADLVYADGASLLLAARWLGETIPERLCTTDIYPELCQLAEAKGYRVFLLGGEDGLAARARDISLASYPRLQVVGVHHGYCDFNDRAVIDRINETRPDVLWVGMGDPRQVLWTEHVRSRLDVKLVLTCGGMFKFITGDLGRISEPWRRRGFEWLGRLLQDPRTTWRRYLIGLPEFGGRIVVERFRTRSRRRS